tara:strand:- start:13 stop:465 length:453 start_codon:yes stop_codon:yes gene_type:complete
MKSHRENYYINSKKEIIFNVIANIENYPSFLPWCIGARIIDTKNVSDIIIQKAELLISFKSFRESFISEVKLDKNNWTVNIVSNKRPFKLLEGCWKIIEKKETCEVSFEISFELKSVILEKIIGLVFFQSVRSIVKAFEDQCLKSNNLIS